MIDSGRRSDPGGLGGATRPLLMDARRYGVRAPLRWTRAGGGTIRSPEPPGTVAVVALPCLDEQSLSRTRFACRANTFSVSHHLPAWPLARVRPGDHENPGLA